MAGRKNPRDIPLGPKTSPWEPAWDPVEARIPWERAKARARTLPTQPCSDHGRPRETPWESTRDPVGARTSSDPK